MKIYDESLYCQECGTEISIQESLFNSNMCSECSSSTEEKPSMSTEQTLVTSLVATMRYGAIVADIDATHRIIQVAQDEDNVFIVPQFDAGSMQWSCYQLENDTIVYFKRESSGYYQLQQAKYFLEDVIDPWYHPAYDSMSDCSEY